MFSLELEVLDFSFLSCYLWIMRERKRLQMFNRLWFWFLYLFLWRLDLPVLQLKFFQGRPNHCFGWHLLCVCVCVCVNAHVELFPVIWFVNWHSKIHASPGWCGSVDWEADCEAEGRWFDSRSGHMPGLRARSPVGCARKATTLMFVSLSFSFPSPLSKHK